MQRALVQGALAPAGSHRTIVCQSRVPKPGTTIGRVGEAGSRAPGRAVDAETAQMQRALVRNASAMR